VFAFDRSADLLLVLIIGGTGYLYGGLIGAVLFKLMQDYISGLTPQYWPFWIGLLLVVIVMVGRERITAWTARSARWRAASTGARSAVRPPPLRSCAHECARARDHRPGEAVRRP
jgi:branched-chain amino acid transport system permease protein